MSGAPEPRELGDARRRLAEAEADYGSAEGLARLGEGLALLDDVIASGAPPHARTARNLASVYAARICGRISEVIERDAAVPEPELEHYFKVVLAFDLVSEALPPTAKELKIAVVRQLIERYYEGHSPETKQRALAELEQLARRD
jgi:hypothetical protein